MPHRPSTGDRRLPLLPRLASIWRNLFRGAAYERDLDDELRGYVELLAEEKIRAGVPPHVARREARVEAGAEQVKEEVRESRAGSWIEGVARDFHYALRGLRRSPAFAVTAVGSVGLAIGASTIVFTWTERLVFRPLPAVPEAGRLVRAYTAGSAGEALGVSQPDYADWRRMSRSFEGIAAQAPIEVGLGAGGRLVRAGGAATSRDYFEVLRVRPALGRTFLPADEAGPPTAVISHRLWRRMFHGDSGIAGRTVQVNGHAATVIGVAPARFAGADPTFNVDVWIPVRHYGLVSCSEDALALRGVRVYNLFARLRPGVTIEEAGRDLDRVQKGLAQRYEEDRGTGAIVVPVQGWRAFSWISGLSAALLGVTLVVVLVACANAANLLLERAASRRREIGIRLAVGAGRARLVRQWLVESGVLALGGGGLGLLLAVFGKGLVVTPPASELPIGAELFLDARITLFTVALAAAAALLIGLVPAWRASAVDPVPALRGGAATRVPGRGRLESAMVVVQVALSVVCLVFAAVFLRGARRVLGADTGMKDPRQVLVFSQRLYLAGYDCATGPPFTRRLLAQVRSVPGVRMASVATYAPLGVSGPMSAPPLRAEGASAPVVEVRGVWFSAVGTDYFETVGTPIVRGRGFTGADVPGTGLVAVVNQTLARRLWPGREALGGRLLLWGQSLEVVGVARDARYTTLEGPPEPFLYVPTAQNYQPEMVLLVRAAADPREVQGRVQRVLAELEPRLPFDEGRTLLEHTGAASWRHRVAAQTVGSAAALALLLCAIGLYGMLAYTVAQRTREIGVRVAVGAGVRDVVGLVVGPAMRLTWVGLAIGVALAFAVEPVLRGQMLSVGPPDAMVVGAVVLVLAAVALLAAWLPARRATRVDPAVALEAE